MADGDVEAAAEHLAKVAVHVRRHGPVVKQADILSDLGGYLSKGYGAVQGAVKPYVPNDSARDALINGLIGAGVGGVGAGAVGLASGKRGRRAVNDALVGALGGGALGGAGTLIAGGVPKLSGGVATPDEVQSMWRRKSLPGKLMDRVTGGAPADTSLGGDVGGALAAHPLAAGGAAAGTAGVAARQHYNVSRSKQMFDFLKGLDVAEKAAPGTMPSLQRAVADPAAQAFRSKIHATMADPMDSSIKATFQRNRLVNGLNRSLKTPGAAGQAAFNEISHAGSMAAGPSAAMGSRPRFFNGKLGRGVAAATLIPAFLSALAGGSE